MVDTQETARSDRAKRKAIMKRNECLKHVRAIHSFTLKCVDNVELVPQLEVLLEEIDDIWTVFTMETETLIDCLIDLNLEAEYSDAQVFEMRELMSFSKAITRRYHDYPRTVVSGQGWSRTSMGVYDNVYDNRSKREHDQQSVHISSVTQNIIPDQHAIEIPSINDNSAPNSIINLKPARLPEIPSPTFHGDILKWLSFRDRFISMVDQRPNIMNIEKFYYLVGCLKDDALDTISGIPVSGDNYQLAWSTLTSRFDRPRLVASSLLEKLLSVPKSSGETLIDLNKFLLIFDEGVAVLESMKIPNLGDFILFSLASRCLPSYPVKLFEAQLSSGFPTVKELLTFVKSRINVLECVPRDHVQRSIKSSTVRSSIMSNGFKSKFNNSKGSQQSSLVAHSINARSTGTCVICTGSHSVSTCKTFIGWSADVHHKWVRDNKACYRCLRSGHWAQNCRSPVQCDRCPRKHHPLVHFDEWVVNGRNERITSNSQQNNGTSEVRTSLIGQGHCSSQSVILGTALVHIRDCSGVLHTVRALVD